MAWVSTFLGALLVGAVLVDVTLTLWHPRGQGILSPRLMAGTWRLAHRFGRDGAPTPLAGPFAVLSVILTWGGGVVLAWSLVYLPHMPDGFSFGSSLDPGSRSSVLDALYLSLVTSATLGLGDIVPVEPVLRVLVPLEALVGFLVLTAVVTWSLQIHPVLGRRRAFAARLAALAPEDVTLDPDDSASASLVHELAGQVSQVRADLAHYGETYVFRDAEVAMSLPAQIGVAQRVAEQACHSPRRSVVAAGAALGHALDGLAEVVRPLLPRPGEAEGTADVLAAWSEDHGHPR